MRAHKFVWLLGLFVVFGCEKELEYDLPSAQPQLVVNSVFSLDSLIRIEVSLSGSPGSGSALRSLRNPKITLFDDETQVKDFVLDSMYATPFNFGGTSNASVAPVKLFFQQTSTTRVRSGRPYSIEVRYPGMPTITATNTVPRPVRATAIVQPHPSAINIDGMTMVKQGFRIDDNGGRENYYGIEVLAAPNGQPEAAERIPFFSGEKSFSENLTVIEGQYDQGVLYQTANGVYFSNGKFVGREKDFEIYVEEQYTQGAFDLKVRVLTLSKAFFDFAISYQKQKTSAGNPYAEPAQVYSNIENGLGIFAGYAVTEVDL